MSTTAPTEDLTVDHEVVDTTLGSRTRLLRAAAYAVFGLISLIWLGLAVDGGTAHLVFDGHTVGLPAQATVIVVGILILGIAAWQAVRGFGKKATPWAAGVAFVLFMVAFFSWVSTQGINPDIDVVGLLQNTIAPDAWRDKGGTSSALHIYKGLLVVSAPSNVQRQVVGTLAQFRAAAAAADSPKSPPATH